MYLMVENNVQLYRINVLYVVVNILRLYVIRFTSCKSYCTVLAYSNWYLLEVTGSCRQILSVVSRGKP